MTIILDGIIHFFVSFLLFFSLKLFTEDNIKMFLTSLQKLILFRRNNFLLLNIIKKSIVEKQLIKKQKHEFFSILYDQYFP